MRNNSINKYIINKRLRTRRRKNYIFFLFWLAKETGQTSPHHQPPTPEIIGKSKTLKYTILCDVKLTLYMLWKSFWRVGNHTDITWTILSNKLKKENLRVGFSNVKKLI